MSDPKTTEEPTLVFQGRPRHKRGFVCARRTKQQAIKQAMRRLRVRGGGLASIYMGDRLIWQRGAL